VNTGVVEKIEFVMLDTLGTSIAEERNHNKANIINNNDGEEQ
jgi:hypothetical protein